MTPSATVFTQASCVQVYTVLPRCYAPPPTLFLGKFPVQGYFTSITRPPPPPPPLWYYSSCTCTHVEAHRKNRSRPFSLISDGFLRPLVLHVILLCNPQLVGGVWLRDYLLYFAENSIVYMYRTAPLLCPPLLRPTFRKKRGGGGA